MAASRGAVSYTHLDVYKRQAYGYDPDGNLVSGTPESGSVDPSALGWNAAAELACQNTNGTSCSLSSPTSSTTTLAYDGNDNLTSWTTGTSGSQTSQALTWSATASNQLLSSYAAPADETTDYVYGLHATPLEQVTLAGSSTVTNLPVSYTHLDVYKRQRSHSRPG